MHGEVLNFAVFDNGEIIHDDIGGYFLATHHAGDFFRVVTQGAPAGYLVFTLLFAQYTNIQIEQQASDKHDDHRG